jgi:hypothetical protein
VSASFELASLVLGAAFLRAVAVLLLRPRSDRVLSAFVPPSVQGCVAVALLPVTDLPALAAWPYLIAGAVLHLGAGAAFVLAAPGERAHAGAIAAAFAAFAIAAYIHLGGVAPVAPMIALGTVGAGLLALGLEPEFVRRDWPGALGAVACGFLSALALIADFAGVRAADAPFGYAAWQSLALAAAGIPVVMARMGGTLHGIAWHDAPRQIASGLFALFAAMGIAWALSLAPLVPVAGFGALWAGLALLLPALWHDAGLGPRRAAGLTVAVLGALALLVV